MTISARLIEYIAHPYAWQLTKARQDQATITGQEMVERPWWYRHTEIGQCYHDIVSCISWPDEVTGAGEARPGYIAIIGIVRADESPEHIDAEDANFQMLEEFESGDVQTLLKKYLNLRQRYGFGIQPDLLTMIYGDSERFEGVVGLFNERLHSRTHNETNAISIVPPDDFDMPMTFDLYMRSLRSVLTADSLRLYFGHTVILKNRLREFRRDDPAITAVGGLVHTLISRCLWMSDTGSNVFTITSEQGGL